RLQLYLRWLAARPRNQGDNVCSPRPVFVDRGLAGRKRSETASGSTAQNPGWKPKCVPDRGPAARHVHFRHDLCAAVIALSLRSVFRGVKMMKNLIRKFTTWQSAISVPAVILFFVLSAPAQSSVILPPIGGRGGGQFVARCPQGQHL